MGGGLTPVAAPDVELAGGGVEAAWVVYGPRGPDIAVPEFPKGVVEDAWVLLGRVL